MLKPISRLRFACKGNLNKIPNSEVQRVRKRIHIIPVLGIFALLGILILSLSRNSEAWAAGCCAWVDKSDYPDGYDVEVGCCHAIPSKPTPEAIESSVSIKGASLIIDGGTIHDTIKSIYGTNYVSHTVSVAAEEVEGYALTLSGDSQLAGPNNAKNNWSYAWDVTSKADNAMSYKAMGNNISLAGDAVNSDGKVDFSRKLAFSTTFADNAASGTYSGKATLSLVITPKTVTKTYVPWDKMFYLQDMSPEACASVSVGTTKMLYDYRSAIYGGVAEEDGGINYYEGSYSGDKYAVQRLADGNCWMTQNLKLDLRGSYDATVAESDNLPASYPSKWLLVSSASSWSSTATAEQYNTNGFGNSNYNSAYGYYYSWCAATGGTCSGATIEGADATGSICPKGWKLPKGGTDITTNDFAKLMNTESGVSLSSLITNPNVSWSSKLNAGSPAYFTLGGTNWYRAGYVDSGGLNYSGSNASYWSRTAYNDTYAYSLYLGGSNLYPADSSYRYRGNSIRCVAYAS